ncbi:MAG TPA: aminotransferase class V-fold PLP-dependent enzyme [Acidimicrobiales bacterium]|nr:aminotransferase class V-fold PLP-dependent enzyme [Acidimicrobiales bacterium]
MSPQYYFDHAASAPRRDAVSDAMARWQHGVVGNPSGSHRAAREARRALEDARDEVASYLGAKPGGVVFTGGGSESCYLALAGVTHHHRRSHERTELIVSQVEHHAVLDTAMALDADYESVHTHLLDVDHEGVVDLGALRALLNENTAIVSVMAVNNETGVREPLDGVASVVHSLPGSAVTHTDAVAAAPWLDLSVVTGSMDMVSICAHKLGGPVNSGALVVRSDVVYEGVVPGGGQERGHRGGTVDVAAAVGLATALRETARELQEANDRVYEYQQKIGAALSFLPGCRVTAENAARVPGTVHVTFEGLASDELLFLLDQEGVCAAAAASCSSGASVSSHVLAAMGVAPERARGSVRFSMGAETTDDDVDALIRIVSSVVYQLHGEK